jgi:hypothetical protein
MGNDFLIILESNKTIVKWSTQNYCMNIKTHSKSKESNTNCKRIKVTSLLFSNKHGFKRKHECKREILKITPYKNSCRLIAIC